LSKFGKKCDKGFLLGYSTTSKTYRVWNLASGTLKNLDDVRGTKLSNAMEKMDASDIRPREVIEVKDDKDQVLSNSNVQASGSHD
jgi:hypothetical protein